MEPIDTSTITEWKNLIDSSKGMPGFTHDG